MEDIHLGRKRRTRPPTSTSLESLPRPNSQGTPHPMLLTTQSGRDSLTRGF